MRGKPTCTSSPPVPAALILSPNAAKFPQVESLSLDFVVYRRISSYLLLLADTMKLAFMFGVALAGCASPSAVDSKSEDLTAATAVMIADQRVPAFRSTPDGLVPDLRSTPITITDSNTVAALVSAIQNAPGKWKRGSFTVPAGDRRLAFLRDSQVLAVIGLGEKFLVRGSGGDWEFKTITKELEDKIAALSQQQPPNQHLPPTPR